MTQEEKLDQIMDAFADIRKFVDDCIKKQDPYSSDSINELAAALSKAQGEYKPIGYNRENPYFKAKYADLDAIMNSVRPALVKNGLSFIQQTRIGNDGITILHSILMHASGQWVESRVRVLPAKNDAQTFGSTLTYQKRYAAASLLGVTTSHDLTDDDGEVGMAPIREGNSRPSYKPEPMIQYVTSDQLEQLEFHLQDDPELAVDILTKMKIGSLAELPKDKFLASVKRIQEIKNIRNSNK